MFGVEWSPCSRAGWALELLESSFAEKGLIALVDNRLDVDQQGAFATKAICKLGSLGKSIAARSRKVIFPLYLAFEITSGILCMVLGSPVQGRLEQIRAECSRGPRSWRQAPGVMGKEKLRELGLLSVRKRWLFTAPRWGTWGRQSWTLLGAAQVSSRRQDCRCAHFHYRHWGSRGTALLSVCPLSFPTYVLAMPASGKTGIVFIACPLEDGRASPFLLLLSMVLLIL